MQLRYSCFIINIDYTYARVHIKHEQNTLYMTLIAIPEF